MTAPHRSQGLQLLRHPGMTGVTPGLVVQLYDQPLSPMASGGQEVLRLVGSLDRLRGNRQASLQAYPEADFGCALE